MPFFKKQVNDMEKNALQVPCSCAPAWRKRVLSSASRAAGSLTLEAALALSLFIFASVCLMLPMQMLDLHRRVQMTLEVPAEDMSQYLYLESRAGEESVPGSAAGDEAEQLESYKGILAQILAEGYLRNRILSVDGAQRISQLDLSGTSIMEDGEHVVLCAEFKYVMPFSVLHLKSIPMTARSVRRVWIGREGGLDHGADLGENEEDQTVYIGKTSERYHWFRDCHYLSNKIEAVAWEDLDGFRNSSGSRYRPCSVCGGGTGGTVYIMESGESYHRNRYCTAIVAYVEAVPLSEVEYMGACSYCERRRGN